jgi:hypothetical protein
MILYNEKSIIMYWYQSSFVLYRILSFMFTVSTQNQNTNINNALYSNIHYLCNRVTAIQHDMVHVTDCYRTQDQKMYGVVARTIMLWLPYF